MSEMRKSVVKALNQSEGPSREAPEAKYDRLASAAIEAVHGSLQNIPLRDWPDAFYIALVREAPK